MRAPRLLSLAAVMLAALTACNGDDDDPSRLTVMTRNLYLGTDYAPVLLATTDEEFLAATQRAWAEVQSNDFRARAAELAAEIDETRPDLVGLQEVSLWRTQTPSDAIVGGDTPATDEAIDYLKILLEELGKRGLTYEPVVTLDLFDAEVPVPVGEGAFIDARLTDRQVILARQGLAVSNPRAAVFTERPCTPGIQVPPGCLLPVEFRGIQILVQRGWTAVDAAIAGTTVSFFNTHLEVINASVRTAQAVELATIVNAQATGPVILVGDLNSPPGTEGHAALAGLAGLSDAWAARQSAPGFTCCFAADLSEPRTTDDLDERIDYVLWRGALVAESIDLVGEADADRTPATEAAPSGLWPSDHAGVVATFASFAGT